MARTAASGASMLSERLTNAHDRRRRVAKTGTMTNEKMKWRYSSIGTLDVPFFRNDHGVTSTV